jgi:hypothetical protein
MKGSPAPYNPRPATAAVGERALKLVCVLVAAQCLRGVELTLAVVPLERVHLLATAGNGVLRRWLL